MFFRVYRGIGTMRTNRGRPTNDGGTTEVSTTPSRGMWSSRAGFILAAAGSAVGLGNIWGFPTQVGQGGGAAFVVVYFACIF